MKRISGIISYDGTGFSGYQVQPKQRTVQGELEKVLRRIHKGEYVKTTASGRTDAGVHAVGQVFHFDTGLSIEPGGWIRALNAQLPSDIRIVSMGNVHSDFHARFDVTEKEYRYRIFNGEHSHVFRRNYTYHIPYALDVEAMKQATSYFVGTHDFTSFCSTKSVVKNRVRTIYKLDLVEDADELVVIVKGNGFLYNMVRIIVGTLLDVGSGRITADILPPMMEAKDRNAAGKTAPAHGLYLWHVSY
ncbi:tRNA pseudouridine(38-40) synthase TruA [Alkalihalobacillus sp. AL-G]|uniref:tRNA pseudouridine(38-40) synthase TruA n=1 Tax=Alkalihalobacillus sp. AL-G TaxID=2926399 RepID=UPI00272A5F96|nr:tRNA pseudouridine(38-40) synthase TruA [Alkalihalobacillus sp. AL-G]WLD93560.1 tRNA pseudouridine(38-40) synthase TruA [Alkalihalobacillus sp. AL-G]